MSSSCSSGKRYSTPSKVVFPDTITARSSRDIACPFPSGFFSYGTDCKKFIECWNNRPFVKSCPAGTLFNADIQECDFISRVTCSSGRPNSRPTRALIQPPPSGQIIRIRGGKGPWEGYVHIYNNSEWRIVCDPDRTFTMEKASHICRQLGFSRGSLKVSYGSETYGKEFGGVMIAAPLTCKHNIESIEDCKVREDIGCDIMTSALSLQCQTNYRSACPEHSVPYNNMCYKFIKDRKTYEQSKEHCQKLGGHLVDIHSQEEMDWLAESLRVYDTSNLPWQTSGIHIRAKEIQLDTWESLTPTFSFYKWWPGWPQNPLVRRQTSRQINCIVLQRYFPSRSGGRAKDADYYFWDATSCSRSLPSVCEIPQIDIDCYSENGKDYTGKANVTESGKQCINWSIAISMARKARQLGRNSDLGFEETNFCRNPFEDEDQPWCFTDDGTFEYCDIPICKKEISITPPVTSVTTSSCSSNQFECLPGKCIYLSYVCDDHADCPNGRDEANCLDYLPRFKRLAQYRMTGHEREKWLYTDALTCARRCAENTNFICKSFSFRESTSTCVLSDKNKGLTGSLAKDQEFVYFEYKPRSLNCSTMFTCDNGKCVDMNKTCDGIDNCGDDSDERDCDKPPPQLVLRLVNGTRDGEGRLEVKVFHEWGMVCSNDNFDLSDAHVACRQLGYSLGAAAVHTGSKFGLGDGPFIINSLVCKGNESSVNECSYPGWGSTQCKTNEAVSLCCLEPEGTCANPESEWMCTNSSKECIPLSFLCDNNNDCSDGSDESTSICQSPVTVRLAGGLAVAEGRLEVRNYGMWGTVCDDDFTIQDATVFCKMLGYTKGAEMVIFDGRYGEGVGPIWLDNLGCSGNESCLLECPNLRWGTNNCHHGEDIAIKCIVDEDNVFGERGILSTTFLNNTILPEDCGTRIIDDNPVDPTLFSGRVYSGIKTEPGAHPWQASLRVRTFSGTFHWCGAVIISRLHVLTAAHCVEDYPKGAYYVRVGDFDNRRTFIEEEEKEFNIDAIHVHENANEATKHNNDLAVIKLKSGKHNGIQFGKYVRPVCLPERNAGYKQNRKCTISGWGSTGLSAKYAHKLHSATIPMLSMQVCRSKRLYGPSKITDGMFCAGFVEGGIDSCQGDSGGPYTCKDEDRYHLYGIISWGIGCAQANKPGVYVRVGHYIGWIYSKIIL